MEKDIVVRIEELMDLFDEGEVTTADKVGRSEEALRREMFQNAFKSDRTEKAGGGRIGFKKGLSVELYNSLINEYTNVLDEGVKNNKLINAPSWESFVTSKGYKTASLTYYADKPAPTKLLKEKKLELANKLIDAENLKLNGITKGAGEGASSIFQGKITNNRIGHLSKSIEGDLSRLVDKKLDTRKDKINKAFNYIMNPDYKMSTKGNTGVAHEIQKLIAPNTTKGRITKEIRLVLDTIPEYKAAEDKFKYINRILSKVPTGTDTSMGYLMEMAENNKLGKANFEDWWKLAGDKPEQFAMREVMRNWNNAKGKGDFKLYNLNGKEIIWKGKDNKISINKILFSYADPDDFGYKNKLYSFFKPDEKTLAKINIAVPNEGVFDLKGNIRNLNEFDELVEIVDGRNKLFNTEMIDPFTGEKSTYKKVYENIYKNIKTTAYGTKKGYSRVSAMAGHIDHEFGTKKYPFNNLRISTGQQNLMFKTLADAAENNEALKPYVKALEAEMYTGGSVDDQIKAIVNETNELGKIVKNAPGKITIPTATETAAFKFLKNEIPDIPESVINYLQPKAEAAEKILQETPNLGKAFDIQISDYFCDRKAGAKGGRLGFANGTCPISEKKKNLVNYSKRVVAGDVAPETAERIAKEVAKVTAKVGSKGALATFLGPAGIGLDIVYEVGSIGFDMAYGTPFKRALENNWITGAFTKTTGEEAYNKDLFAKFPQAQPYGRAGEIINRMTKIERALDNMDAGVEGLDSMNNPQRYAALEAEYKNLEKELDVVGRKEVVSEGPAGKFSYETYKALEPGSNEQIAYNQAKQEFDAIEAAKAPIKPMSKAGFEQMIKEGAQDRPVLGKMDIGMIPDVTAFTKKQLDDVLFNVGQEAGFKSTPSPYSFGLGEITVGPQAGKYSEILGYQQLADILQQDLDRAKTDEIARAGGVANLAGGGIAKIAGVDSGPPPESGPMSQGLQGLMKRGIKG